VAPCVIAAEARGILQHGETLLSQALRPFHRLFSPMQWKTDFDVLEVSGLLANTSGGVGTHLLPLAGE
jgi:hypothetical protein